VNGADNGLASSAQFSEETNNRVSRLRVKTRGRLIEEEKQRWLSCQLNANGQPLTLLYTKAHNDSVLQVIELKEINDLVHICNLLSTRNRGILSQDSRKLNGLSYGLGCIMKITLKAESSIPLEVCT
jgi:diacylglycerol kinase family enzyme